MVYDITNFYNLKNIKRPHLDDISNGYIEEGDEAVCVELTSDFKRFLDDGVDEEYEGYVLGMPLPCFTGHPDYDPDRDYYLDRLFSMIKGDMVLDISEFDTSNVVSMKCLFLWCWDTPKIIIGNLNTSKLLTVTKMFEGCSLIWELDMSGFSTDNVQYFVDMFFDCGNLETLNIQHFSNKSMINCDGMFDKCTGLTTDQKVSWINCKK